MKSKNDKAMKKYASGGRAGSQQVDPSTLSDEQKRKMNENNNAMGQSRARGGRVSPLADFSSKNPMAGSAK